jgi:hypothetical protein
MQLAESVCLVQPLFYFHQGADHPPVPLLSIHRLTLPVYLLIRASFNAIGRGKTSAEPVGQL